MTDNALITWSVLMPVKVLSEAKSRLAGLAGPRRGELALAVACDTVTAVMRTDQAARAIVITDDPVAASALRAEFAQVIPDEPRDGLNAALRHGAAVAAEHRPSSPVPCKPPPAGRTPSWPTPPETAPRCTRRRPAWRSGRPLVSQAGPGTRRAAPPNSS
jgi:hypothetical protein